MSQFIRHEPCPACGSSDALARYANGTATCFSCRKWFAADGAMSAEAPTATSAAAEGFQVSKDFVTDGVFMALPGRGVTRETCEFWGYRVVDDDDEVYHVASYRNASGKLTNQKLRRKGKNFTMIGGGNAPLYGMWLWGKGKSITITEGEIDALSVSQAFQNRFAVVSLPNGAQSAAKDIGKHLDYLDQFERVVLMLDQDEHGQKATEEVAALLPPGKAYVAVLPGKDANEVLVEKGEGVIVKAFWEAKPWRPDGIVSGEDFTVEGLKQASPPGYTLPWPKLEEALYGLRKGEITLLTAGSGIGKSSLARELAYFLHQHHLCTIGNVYLEESNAKTAQAYVAIHNNIPLKVLRKNPDVLPDADWERSLDEVIRSAQWFYNHFGSLESKRLLTKLRYLAVVCGVDFIVLDHISLVVSGQESSSEGERKDIDLLMTRLRSLAEETGVGIIAIVHLKRVSGKVFNEGSEVSLSDLRGSGSLEQLSDNVIALERNQQDDKGLKDISRIRVLKCRETGDTGLADTLRYNRETGRMEWVAPEDAETLEAEATPFAEVPMGASAPWEPEGTQSRGLAEEKGKFVL